MLEVFIPIARILGSSAISQKAAPIEVKYDQWDESNPCYHCGRCCSNVTLELSLVGNHASIFGELYPHVKNPNNPYLSLRDVPEEDGVYYVIGKRGYYLCIRGACPQLQADNSCGIHDKNRPRGCVTSGIHSLKCITNR